MRYKREGEVRRGDDRLEPGLTRRMTNTSLSKYEALSAFSSEVPDGVEMFRLCSCSRPVVVSVMPITSSERAYAVASGPKQFIELLEQRRVPNLFDPFRQAVV